MTNSNDPIPPENIDEAVEYLKPYRDKIPFYEKGI